jgi:tetratricopeptide (TPR) repeat protein
MDRIRFVALIVFLCANAIAMAQAQDSEKAQQYANDQEQYKRSIVMREYDSALFLMDEQRYQEADIKFRYVLENLKSLPSDLTFYFGKNSYLLGKHKQSIDWLNKYIQLKGTNGQHYTQAVEWKKKAEDEFLKEKRVETKKVEQVFSTDYDIDCGTSGMVVCPVCKGDHVIIKKGAFGNEYRTCGYCNEHGVLTCDEYNKLLRGELKPKG